MATSVQMEMVTLKTCPVCGGDDIPVMYQRRIQGPVFACYSICNGCGQWFLNPRMTDDYTARYYQGIYRDLTLADRESANTQDATIQAARAEIQSTLIAKHGKPKSHLEIGCSRGYLLDAMRERGVSRKQSVGIEPDERFYNTHPASDYRMVGDISNLDPRAFDLISMSHSLEHINHPVEYMTNLVKNYAKPGTLIMIEVPNLDATTYAFLLHHPLAYSETTLVQLMERCACKVLETGFHALGVPLKTYLIGIFEVI